MNFTISQVAEQFNLTTRTLRYYEELGLIKPSRNNSKQRLYTNKECTRIKLIIRGKQLGFTLEEIKDMLNLFDVDPSGKKQLERSIEYGNKKIAEIEQKIMDLVKIKTEIERLRDDFLQRLEN